MKAAVTANIFVDVQKVRGDIALCRISGDLVQGGVIFIPPGGSYNLEFELRPGHSGLTWTAGSDPISSRVGDCPTGSGQAPGFAYTGKNGNNPVVHATPASSGKTVVHYALHFDRHGAPGPVTCDPIIIHD